MTENNHQQPESKIAVFLSYSRKDGDFVRRLANALDARGYAPIFDQSDRQDEDPDLRLTAQDEWWSGLKTMIAASDVIVFIVTPESAASPVCDDELAHARNLGKRVITVLRRPIDFNTAPERLRSLNVRIDFQQDNDRAFGASLEVLNAELLIDVHWHRQGTRLMRQANQWDKDGRPEAQLLRSGAIADADAWAARRPRGVDEPGPLLLAYLGSSRAKEESDAVRLKSLIGRGFVMPVEQAVRDRRYEYALRLMAAGASLSEDWHFRLSPELFLAGAASIAQSSLLNSQQVLPETINVIAHDSTGKMYAASGGHQVFVESTGDSCVRILDGHTDKVLKVQFSIDGLHLLTSAEDGTVSGWRISSGERRFTLDAPVDDSRDGYYTFAEYSPDGQIFMISSPQGPKIIDTESLDHITTLEHSDNPVWHASFSPDGKLIATACLDGRVRIWSTEGWRVLKTLHPNQQAVMTAQFSACGSRLITHTLDTGCQVWNVADWSVVARINETSLCVSRAGAMLLTSVNNVGRIWDLRNGAIVSELRGHQANIDGAAFFGEERVATISSDGTSRVWNAHDGEPVDVFLAEGGPFSAIAFATAEEVRTGSQDGRVRSWRVGAEFVLGTLQSTSRPGELLGLSSGGDVYAVYSSMDGGCRVLDGSSNNLLTSRDIHDAGAVGADFSGDGGRCVAWFTNGVFVVWDIEKNEDVLRSTIEQDEVFDCRLSSDAFKLATRASGKLYLYSLKASAPPFVYDDELVSDFAFAEKQLRCVTIDSDAHVATVRNLPSRRVLKKLQCENGDEEFSARLSNDGRWLITRPSPSEIRWVAVEGFGAPKRHRVESGELLAIDVFNGELCLAEKLQNGHVVLRALPRMNLLGEIGFEVPVQSIWLCSKSRTVVCGLADATTRRFNLLDSQTNALTVEPRGTSQIPVKIVGPSNEVLVKVAHDSLAICNADDGKTSNILRANYGIKCVALSADDELIAIGDYGGGAQVWRRSPLKRLHRFHGQVGIESVRFHPNGRYVCAASGPSIWIWNLENGQPGAKLEHVDRVSDVQFSPDGRFLVVRGDDPPVIIWDTQTWTEHARLEFKSSYLVDAQFSGSGSLFATASWGDAVRLWDAATWREIAWLQDVGTRPSKICFDKIGDRMIVGTDSGVAFVLDVSTKAVSARLVGHGAKITCQSFLPSSSIVVTSSENGTVRFWDVASGAELYRIDCHQSRVFDVAVSSDGSSAITSAADLTVKFWAIDHLSQFRGDAAEYVSQGLQNGRGELLSSERAHLLLRDVRGDLLSEFRSAIAP